MPTVIGWDIGGAHLKAARAENGRIVDAVQLASPLRLGLERLRQSFGEAKARMGKPDRHVVTMTGELADTFASRAEGVASLTQAAVDALAPEPIAIYAGRAGFVPPAQAGCNMVDIASANWFASATLVGKALGSGLFIDIGSTTTDIVPVASGAVVARGYTDAERLAQGELVYAGIVRSFLMAAERRAPFGGSWVGLMHENFANMADVQRILGILPDGADQMSTADGREKTVEASRARLARMVGRDVEEGDAAAWARLARWFAEAQLRAILDGAMLVLSQGTLLDDAPVVAAGAGATMVHEVARRLGRDCVGFDRIIDAVPAARAAASNSAPAAAVALLASMG